MLQPWMIIGGITLLLGILGGGLVRPSGIKWFKRLQRPRWLTFEPLIPVIWTFVFTCGAISAIQVWEQDPGSSKTWFLMGFYVLVELVTLAYSPATLFLKNLKVGTIVGAVGFVLALILAITVFPISRSATLLLLPYLLWSPIGTYTTWEMMRLNPQEG